MVPFPEAADTFEFVFPVDSPESLEFRRGPESENNLPDIFLNLPLSINFLRGA